MTYLHALLFSIVEGISEFLPISSTGHLILTGRLLVLEQTEFLKSFEIAIQLGAILSVLVLYWKSFVLRMDELSRVLCAFFPTAVVGFALYKVIKKYLLADVRLVLVSLFAGGVILILFERWHSARSKKAAAGAAAPEAEEEERGISRISHRQAVLIGLAQSLAVVPGVSRSAATIVAGLALGVRRRTIVEFSFLLAVPTMAAATALDIVKSADVFSLDQAGILLTGFAGSFLVALACIRWFLKFVSGHSFVAFGVYRIAVALVFWIYLTASS